MFTIKRSEENPFISPIREHSWEAAATFNWCPIKDGRETHVVYRALSERELLEEPLINRSVIGRATTRDGVHFNNREPFIVPDQDFDKFGCEDPRVTKIGDTYFIFYTALGGYPFNADNIKVAVAISKDMKTITEKHLITPFNAKAMVLFPEKIKGKYAVLLTFHTDLPDTNIALATFDKLEDMWSQEYWDNWYKERDSHIINLRRGSDEQVEVGAPPIKTKEGWLLVYSHATHYFSSSNHLFGVEAVILDKNDPQTILGQTKGSFLTPELYYEQTGLVPNVIFPSGAMIRGDYLDIYYGGADTHCCKASVRLDDLLEEMLPNNPSSVNRFAGNPILTARPGKDWEAHGVFNPAAVDYEGVIHILYRAMSSDETSTVGYASSKDGLNIDTRDNKPIYIPRAEFETKHQPGNSGCEDPRIMYMDHKFIMTYTAYDGHVPRVAATTISEEDFKQKKWKNWSMPVIITPGNVPNKDSVLVPEKTKDGYVVLHRIHESICADILPSLNFEEAKVHRCIEILSPRRGMWDGAKIGVAAPPIKTKVGWLLLYHGISENNTYRVGAALLDLKDPTIVLSRSATPLFEPVEEYELKGVIPNVVFPCGVVKRKDKLFIYYGGADTVVGVATAKFSKIIDRLI